MSYRSLNQFVNQLSRHLNADKVKRVIKHYEGSDIFKPIHLFADRTGSAEDELENITRSAEREWRIQKVMRQYEQDPRYQEVCGAGEQRRAALASRQPGAAEPTEERVPKHLAVTAPADLVAQLVNEDAQALADHDHEPDATGESFDQFQRGLGLYMMRLGPRRRRHPQRSSALVGASN